MGQDKGEPGCSKCQREGEPFQGDDTGGVRVVKKTKSKGGRYRAILSAETGKARPRKDRYQDGAPGPDKEGTVGPSLGLPPSPWETREEPAFRTVAGSTVMPSPWARFFIGADIVQERKGCVMAGPTRP